MKLILSVYCTSFTGALSKSYGYAVRKHNNGFYGYRNSRGDVPPDGHLRFIIACAKLAGGLYVADIEIDSIELACALKEAGHKYASWYVTTDPRHIFHAADILNLKTRFKL